MTTWPIRAFLIVLISVAMVSCAGSGAKTPQPSPHATMTPSETVTQQAQAAAAKVRAIEPLPLASNTCIRAIINAAFTEAIDASLEKLIGAGKVAIIDKVSEVSDIAGTLVKIDYEKTHGQPIEATFDFGQIVFAVLGDIPGFKLFGIIGEPAIDCTETAFWYTGHLGYQLGVLLRRGLQPPTPVAAAIQGNWTLYRRSASCSSNLSFCAKTPMLMRITCDAANCTIIRTNNIPGRLGAWADPLPLVLHGGVWRAAGPEAGASECHGNPAPGTLVALSLTAIATAGVNGGGKAQQLQGTFAVDGGPTPCTNETRSVGNFVVSTSG